MTAALLKKEARELLPWGILGLALGVSSIAEHLLSQVDMTPLGRTFVLLNGFHLALYWLIAFAIGTGLAIREHDDGTLAFLDGLPVSRSRVFWTKCVVMAAFVMIGPFLEIVAITALHLLSRESLDRGVHGALLLEAFAVQALLLLNGLMLGAAIGRLRSLTWLAAGLGATALLLLVERMPRAAMLNPLTLLEWQWTSSGILVDGEALAAQIAITAAAALIAWQGFVAAGKSREPLNLTGPIASAVVAGGTIATGIAVLVLLAGPSEQSPGPISEAGPSTYRFTPSPPAQTQTRHYRISYPAHEAEAALALAAEADSIFERVHALLGVELGDPVDVDASGSAPNTHGTAFLGRLRMELDSEVDAVLAHETVHVVAQRFAGAERAWLWQAADVLNEGLASWVETRFRDRVERTDERMFLLAAMHARRELRMEELADPVAFQMMRDETVKYAAGEALIAALVRLHGEAALARLLRAFDDPRLPPDLRGLPLWESTFQLAGFDLAAVVNEFFRAVDEHAAQHAERIAALPRPRVVLVRLGRRVGAMAVFDPPNEDARPELVIRFRPAPDSPLTEYQQFPAVADQPVWPGGRNVTGARMCVQPGVRIGAEVLYEPWACLPTRDAVDLLSLQAGGDRSGVADP